MEGEKEIDLKMDERWRGACSRGTEKRYKRVKRSCARRNITIKKHGSLSNSRSGSCERPNLSANNFKVLTENGFF